MPRKNQQSDALKDSKPFRASPRSTPKETGKHAADDNVSEVVSPSIPVRSRKPTGRPATATAVDEPPSNGTASTTTSSRKTVSKTAAIAAIKTEEETTTAEVKTSTPQSRGRKRKAQEAQSGAEDPKTQPAKEHRTTPRKKQKKSYTEDDSDSAPGPPESSPPPSASLPNESSPPLQPASSTKATATKDKPKRSRQTAEEKAAAAMPLAPRTGSLKMFIGAHVSIAKALENSVTNAQHIGGNAFALFLKSQRKWANPPLQDANRTAFISACKTHGYDASRHVLPHGSYLVNLATSDPDKKQQSYDAFLDDLQRCEALGIKYYNFHPGAAGTQTREQAIANIATQLNKALRATKTVVPVLENMAGRGSIIGSRFEDLRDIISQIPPEHSSRIGVCLDTCHTFAAGYDLRTPQAFVATMKEFDSIVGMKYLKAWHLNDSKAPLRSYRDLHENIGVGFIGLRGFHCLMNDKRMEGLAMVLETPCERADPNIAGDGGDVNGEEDVESDDAAEDDDEVAVKGKKGAKPNAKTKPKMIEDKSIWSTEIKLLESLVGMDAEGSEFKSLEASLAEKGREARTKMSKAVEEKRVKDEKKLNKQAEKGQRSLKDMMGMANEDVKKKSAKKESG